MMKKEFFYSVGVLLSVTLYGQGPANDDCLQASSMQPNATCIQAAGTVSMATQSTMPITCATGASALAKDVWYTFQASSPNATITASPSAQPGNNFNLVLGLYSACNGILLACSDMFGNLQPETINVSGLTTGSTYYLRVYQYKSNTSSADPVNPTFSICVQDASINTGVNQLQTQKLKISPNPAQNFLILDEALAESLTAILIYDVSGKTVFYADDIKQRLDISQITPGAYSILCVRRYGDFNSSERVYYQNFIKE